MRQLAMPLRSRLVAAHDQDPGSTRALTVVQFETDDGLSGWGECSALPSVGYSTESATTAFEVLANDPRVAEPGGGTELATSAPMAAAALEMAELDLRLRSLDISLATYLGIERREVPAGAAVSLGSIPATIDEVATLVEDGFERVKLKVAPAEITGRSSAAVVAEVRRAFPMLEIQVDGNGSFDSGSLHEVESIAAADISAFEQPFSPDAPALAASLVAAGVPVLADEAATDLVEVQRLVELGACTGVVVKSSRLGGLFPTFELLGWCEEAGVDAAAGGMQESGLGRAALAVVAAHGACTITGDVSPARRWFEADPWDDVVMQGGVVDVPGCPGVAEPPNVEVLDQLTVRQANRLLNSDQR